MSCWLRNREKALLRRDDEFRCWRRKRKWSCWKPKARVVLLSSLFFCFVAWFSSKRKRYVYLSIV